MASAKVASDVRQLLRPDLRFLPGAYPDRPAPAHVMNAFVRAALGSGSGADRIRVISRGPSYLEQLRAHPLLVGAGWASDERLDQLAASLRAVFDADRRVFPASGSPSLVDWRLAS